MRLVYTVGLIMPTKVTICTAYNYTYVAFIAQEWNDFNLAWNASEYGGVTSVRIPPAMIWKPDILLYNRLHIRTETLKFERDGEKNSNQQGIRHSCGNSCIYTALGWTIVIILYSDECCRLIATWNYSVCIQKSLSNARRIGFKRYYLRKV